MEEMKQIDYKTAVTFLLDKHYSGRKPQVSYAYGLFVDGVLNAVITYGIPASRNLCMGVCGEEYSSKVVELNRMCRIDTYTGTLSHFVAWTLKQLKPFNLIVVSYSDTGMNHHGYVYQACNFLYTGKTRARTDKYTPSNKHSRHYDRSDEYKHLRKIRTAKHRYIYLACSKGMKKVYRKHLLYPVITPYPKGDNSEPYTLGDFQKPLFYNKNTKEYFTE